MAYGLMRSAQLVWDANPVLRAEHRNSKAAWLQRVEGLKQSTQTGDEFRAVRNLCDSIIGGGRDASTGTGARTNNTAVPLSKLSPMQLERLLAATPAPVYVPAASASAAPVAPAVEVQPAAKMAYETPEQTRARAAVAFNANSQAGAQLRRDFAGSLSTYQAYEVAMRHRRVKISSGGVKTYSGGAHA